MNTEEKRALERQRKTRILLVKLLHFGLTLVIFYIFWLLFRYGTLLPKKHLGFRYNYLILAGFAVAVYFFDLTYNAYLLGYSRIRLLCFSQFLAQLFSIVLIWVMSAVGWDQWHSPLIFLPMLVIQLMMDAVWSYYANLYYCRLYPPKRTILIYRNELDRARFGSIHGKPTERLYHIDEEFRYEGYSFKTIRHRLEGFEAVFVAGVHSRCRNGIAKYCEEEGIPGFFLPHVGDVILHDARHIQSFDSPVLMVSRKVLDPEYALIKRVFDIVSSFLGLVILSPVMLVTALAIRLYDGGPAIYKQMRLTLDGRVFEIYKFRSMRVDAEKDGVARLSTGDRDDRITPVGRFIRKCRIDELPQLVNILKGDMSVVGPRPERPEIAEQYYTELPDFKLRLQVKAGLTGYAQVYGKYNTDPYEKLEFDLLYIQNMGIPTDLRLMFATFNILFSKESTSGVQEGQVTAAGGIDPGQDSEVPERIIDYEDEKLRAEDAEEVARQWED